MWRCFFFFQAEDGIRDIGVTGVQTCALPISSSWISRGIIWAADHGADVINMSLGGPGSSDVYASAVSYARSKGATVIAAAGNSNSSTPFYPAAEAGVVAVSAVDRYRAKASFSNHGPYVDIAAPGVGIVSTHLAGDWTSMSGTSMASPHVAGVAALVEAAAPGLTPDQVERALVAGARDLGTVGRDDVFGHGLVDAVLAVRAANDLETPAAAPDSPPVTVQAPSAPAVGTPKPANSAVQVRWTPPADDGGAAVTGYRIATYRSGVLVKETIAAGSSTSAT